MNIKDINFLIHKAKEIIRSPKETIECFGEQHAKEMFNDFTKSHPKFPFFF
jgi:hypothetical protein